MLLLLPKIGIILLKPCKVFLTYNAYFHDLKQSYNSNEYIICTFVHHKHNFI